MGCDMPYFNSPSALLPTLTILPMTSCLPRISAHSQSALLNGRGIPDTTRVQGRLPAAAECVEVTSTDTTALALFHCTF